MERRKDIEGDVSTPAYYRAKVRMMLAQAARATNPEIRDSCLSLAQSWEALGEHAEKSAVACQPAKHTLSCPDGAPIP